MSRGRGETARRGLEIFKIRNPQSETGNPPEGWESEGQIRNPQFSSMLLLKNPQPYIYVQLGVMINKVTLYVTLTL
jgi:hypothetical protein